MDDMHTSAAIQRHLGDLAGDGPADPVVRAMLDRAVRRLRQSAPAYSTAATPA